MFKNKNKNKTGDSNDYISIMSYSGANMMRRAARVGDYYTKIAAQDRPEAPVKEIVNKQVAQRRHIDQRCGCVVDCAIRKDHIRHQIRV